MDFLPGWNSIESSAWIHNLLEKFSLYLLVALAIAIGLAYLYGHRRDYLSDEAARAAENARRTAPTDKQASTGQRPVEPAGKPAATNERQVEIVQPRATRDSQRPVAGNPAVTREPPPNVASGQITPPARVPATANRQAAAEQPAPVAEPQREPLAGGETAAAKPAHDNGGEHGTRQATPHTQQQTGAKSAAGIEIRGSGEIDQPRARRHLSDDQKARLHAFLKNEAKGRLTIRINPSVPDASNYGVEIARFFKHETAWSVRIDNSPFTGADLGGMWLALRSADAVPPGTGTLHAALAHAHIPVRPQPVWDPAGPALNEIWLVIGKRN